VSSPMAWSAHGDGQVLVRFTEALAIVGLVPRAHDSRDMLLHAQAQHVHAWKRKLTREFGQDGRRPLQLPHPLPARRDALSLRISSAMT